MNCNHLCKIHWKMCISLSLCLAIFYVGYRCYMLESSEHDHRIQNNSSNSLIPQKTPNVGIESEGNLCYLVTTLQCIISYNDFITEFSNIEFDEKKQPICYNLKRFILEYSKKRDNEVIDPKFFTNIIKDHLFKDSNVYKNQNFTEQQILSEFYIEILNQIEKEIIGKRVSPGKDVSYEDFIINFFFLKLSYETVKVNSQGHENIKQGESEYVLFFSANNISSLSSFLVEYFKDQPINNDNNYGQGLISKRRTKIISLPEYLHFLITTNLNSQSHGDFQIEEEIVINGSIYELIILIYRKGQTCDSGHFYLAAKRNGRWVEFNGKSIKSCQLKKNHIYMLVYKKRERDNIN